MIGLGCIFGTLIEPVTRQPRCWSPAAGLAIGLNLAASAALIAAGLRHSATSRARQCRGGSWPPARSGNRSWTLLPSPSATGSRPPRPT